VNKILSQGYGADSTTDILGVVMEGSPTQMDAELRDVVTQARRAAHGSVLVVVAGTGTWTPVGLERPTMSAASLARTINENTGVDVPLVQASVPGGVFLNEAELVKAQVSGQVVQKAMLGAKDPSGHPVMDDAFQGFAVSFARYC
jgi:hypothetical protein